MTHEPFDSSALNGDALNGDALILDHLDDERVRGVITAYLDDELTPEAARRVTAWLDERPEMLREVEHLRRVWDLLELYEDEEVPEGFAQGVLAEVGIRPIRRLIRGRLLHLPRAATIAAVAALVLVALGLGIWLGRGESPSDQGGRDLATAPGPEEPIEIEYIEEVEYLEEVDVLLALSDDEFEAYLLADLEEPWEDS